MKGTRRFSIKLGYRLKAKLSLAVYVLAFNAVNEVNRLDRRRGLNFFVAIFPPSNCFSFFVKEFL